MTSFYLSYCLTYLVISCRIIFKKLQLFKEIHIIRHRRMLLESGEECSLNFSVHSSCQADLVNVLSSCPSETAGVIAAEDIEGWIVWVGPRGANHFHEHRICILLLCNARVTNWIWGTKRKIWILRNASHNAAESRAAKIGQHSHNSWTTSNVPAVT